MIQDTFSQRRLITECEGFESTKNVLTDIRMSVHYL